MRAVDHFKTLCCLNLAPQAAMIAIAGALHDIIPSEWNRIGFLTESGGLGAGYAEHPDLVTLGVRNLALFQGGDRWFIRHFGDACRDAAIGRLGLRHLAGYQNCTCSTRPIACSTCIGCSTQPCTTGSGPSPG